MTSVISQPRILTVRSTGETTVLAVATPTVATVVASPGPPGATGATGADGVGVPAGGTTAQVLAKIDATDFNTEWVDQTGGGGSLPSQTGNGGAALGTDGTDAAWVRTITAANTGGGSSEVAAEDGLAYTAWSGPGGEGTGTSADDTGARVSALDGANEAEVRVNLDGTVEITATGALKVNTVEVDVSGAATDDVLAFDGTKFAPAAPSGGGGGGIASTIVDAKGDLIVATAADTVARVPVSGTNGWVLTEDSGEAAGVRWGPGPGLVLVGAGAPSGASSFNITGFTSTYNDYRLLMRLTGSTNIILKAKLSVSGTPSSTGYDCTRAFWGSTDASDDNQQGTDEWMWSAVGATPGAFSFDIFSPALAESTLYDGIARQFYSTGALCVLAGAHSAATAYDTITITPDTGTITGRWRLYGYAK